MMDQELITKVNNIFVKLLTAVMKGNLEEVDHFINDDVYKKYNDYIKSLDDKNQRQMYDELNAKFTYINDKKIVDDKELVDVTLVARYMDYILDKDTGDLISGDNTKRIQVKYNIILEKKLNAKDIKVVQTCPGCGASVDVNKSGKCEYCGRIFDLENYDYIVTSIEKI